ncbi:alpha/beta fold hydrolase [uncultured Microscilla sp.]|uniref:alpha/beta fold hydrolase n=1 Tax=uncultured Microscilla sp. TaxID=432653 RepID=UPI002605CE55|nr:alpha/beta fold hydrolase [uncultured Microscilla sp.]
MDRLLAYDSEGKGQKTVVLLHGFCENRTMWRHLVPVLAAQYRVVNVDLGGFGQSAHLLPSVVTMDTLAAQVLALLQSLNIHTCTVLGHSLGGYVALAMAEQDPTLLEGIGLVHSSALPDSAPRQAMRNRIVSIVRQRGVAPFAHHFVQALFLPERLPELAEAIKEAKTMALHTPQKSLIEVTLAMRERPNRSELLQQLACPVLFLIGKQDPAIPMSQYRAQIMLPQDAHIHLLDRTAHMGTWERPKKTGAILQHFVHYCFTNKL